MSDTDDPQWEWDDGFPPIPTSRTNPDDPDPYTCIILPYKWSTTTTDDPNEPPVGDVGTGYSQT